MLELAGKDDVLVLVDVLLAEKEDALMLVGFLLDGAEAWLELVEVLLVDEEDALVLVGVDEDVLAVEDDSELMMVVLVAKRPAPLLKLVVPDLARVSALSFQ